MGFSLRGLFFLVILSSIAIGSLLVSFFSIRFSNDAANFYRKDCKYITFLAAKNLQYALSLYANDAIIYQNLQNIQFRLQDSEAAYLEYKGKSYIYPDNRMDLLKIFDVCKKVDQEKVIETDAGIVACYPLREELASQLLGRPKRIGTFAILFKKEFYEKVKKDWLLKIGISFLALIMVLTGGYIFFYKKIGRDLNVLDEIIAKVNEFINSEKKEDEDKLLEELKDRVRRIFFKELREIASLIYKLSYRFVELNNRLKREAIEDPLTGLYNRNYLKKIAKNFISLAKRENIPFSVAIIDIDDFKNINDTYGHQKGDEVLKALGDVIKSRVRGSDVPIRYGGEEFLILFMNAGKKEAANVLEEIKDKFSQIDFGFRRRVTFSGGVASFPEDVAVLNSLDDLIEIADERLYTAKRLGKNRIIWY
ncbi:diguanylate cyclase (GGDEF) domain-containing protein [Desulfurobacterium pacificum]|uniref:diguanylate cyclase n=1 Tax=Desulfurobacterium pacificum TaxID=240166 RepID=A0ABY1N711_9BACT|nr:GGDEF domain-containing protein [Desulfurobacterium pacificum]SMP01776.1 diguanylate cyclase (GGDEF) domain-containing protein [Desulfurobacterium pacificum]